MSQLEEIKALYATNKTYVIPDIERRVSKCNKEIIELKNKKIALPEESEIIDEQIGLVNQTIDELQKMKQVSLEIYELPFNCIGLATTDEKASSETKEKNSKELLSKSLNVPLDVVNKLSVKYLEDIMLAIQDINSFSDSDMKKTGLREFIESKRK